MLVKYNDNMVWEVSEVSRMTFLKHSANDGGFYLDITEDVESDVLFNAVFWGQKDTLFALDVSIKYEIIYYIGKLKT